MSAVATQQQALLQLGMTLKSAGYAFTTISTPSHRRVNSRAGNEQARDLRGVFGWSRPFEEGLLAPEIVSLMQQAQILERADGLAKSALRASTLDGELYFHSAFPTRATDAVFFGPDTYRYAHLIQAVLKHRPQVRRAVDIGCGAGAGAVMIAKACPQAEVWAVDINPAALALTALNAELAGAGIVQVRHSDLLQALEGQFDLIVANPPFMLDTAQRTYCHGGGELGESLSLDIVSSASERLAPGGSLVLYTCVAIVDGGDPFRERIGAILAARSVDWQYREIDPDVFGGELQRDAHQHTDRIAAVALTVTNHLKEQA